MQRHNITVAHNIDIDTARNIQQSWRASMHASIKRGARVSVVPVKRNPHQSQTWHMTTHARGQNPSWIRFDVMVRI